MLQKRAYDFSVDWWNLGILMYKMCTGEHPYYSEFSLSPIDKRLARGSVPQLIFPTELGISDECRDLICRLLEVNEEIRLGCGPGKEAYGGAEIMEHPFFDSIDWNRLQDKEYDMPEEWL